MIGATSTSDEEVVAAVLQGGTDRFELLMRRHNQRLFRVARAIVRSDDAAFDVLQEAYIKAYQKLDHLAEPARVAGWLVQIVRNEARMHLRARWRLDRIDEAEHPFQEAALMATPPRSPDAAVAARQLRPVLEASIDRLPDDFRETFVLRAVEGMSVREVSELTGVPAATVKTRYHRARKTLQQDLSERLEDTWTQAFQFDGARCDRMVASVMQRVGEIAVRSSGD